MDQVFRRNVDVAGNAIKGALATYYDDGAAASVSASGKAALRYNHASTRFESSINGGAWAALTSTVALPASQIGYGNAGGTAITSDATFVRDATNGRIGLNVATPTRALDFDGILRLRNGQIYRPDDAGVAIAIGNGTNTSWGAFVWNNPAGSLQLMDLSAGGTLTVGTTAGGRSVISPDQVSGLYMSEANVRWSVGRDALGGGQAGVAFGPGGASATDVVFGRYSAVAGAGVMAGGSLRVLVPNASGNLLVGNTVDSLGRLRVRGGGTSDGYAVIEDSSATVQAMIGTNLVGTEVFVGSLSNHTLLVRTNNATVGRFTTGGNFVMGGSSAAGRITSEVADGGTTTVVEALTARHSTSGTAAAGFGVRIGFSVENDAGTNQQAATIDSSWTSAASGAENADLAFSARSGGSLTSMLGIRGGTVPQVAVYIAGTAASPALYLGGATTTGFFYVAANKIGVSNAGVETARFTDNNNVLIGTTTDAAASRLSVVASKAVTAAGAAVWDGVKIGASTLTLSGTTTVDEVALVSIEQPTIAQTGAGTVTVTRAYTMRIAGPAAGTDTTISHYNAVLFPNLLGVGDLTGAGAETIGVAFVSDVAASTPLTAPLGGFAWVSTVGGGRNVVGKIFGAGTNNEGAFDKGYLVYNAKHGHEFYLSSVLAVEMGGSYSLATTSLAVNNLAGGTPSFFADAATIKFFGATGVSQQTSGANLTNSVTAGGTTDTVNNITTGGNVGTDVRDALYQLARKLKQINDGLRTYGLFT